MSAPRRNPARVSRKNHLGERMSQYKLNKDLRNIDLFPNIYGVEIRRNPVRLSHDKCRGERISQSKLNKDLGNMELTNPLDAIKEEKDEALTGQQKLEGPIPKERNLKEASGHTKHTVEGTRENDAVVETRRPRHSEPTPLVFEEIESWETPRAKKASLFAYLDEAQEGYPVTESGTRIKLTIFFEDFEDNGSRALPPIRQDGTPIKELFDIPSIRSKVEKLYLLQFRMMNFDHAVPPKAYQTLLIAEWNDFKVRGVRFSYTDFFSTRIQLPMIKTPADIDKQANFALAKATALPCHCGGFYCRAYNHPIELMVIYEPKAYLYERLELRMEALQKRKAKAEQAREEAAEGNEGEELASDAGPEKSETYEKSSSSEEEDEKVIAPGRRNVVRPIRAKKEVTSEELEVEEEPEVGSDKAETAVEEDETRKGEVAAPKSPGDTSSVDNQAGASGVWAAQVEGLKKGEQTGELDAATLAAIKEALGQEPRRARSTRRG